MRKGTLTREQAVAIVGEEAVAAVERENCDFTNRVQTDGDTGVEFAAYASVDHDDYEHVVAYYYQEQEYLDGCEDLSNLNWEINGYAVV